MRSSWSSPIAVALFALLIGFYGWQQWQIGIHTAQNEYIRGGHRYAVEKTDPILPDDRIAYWTVWIAAFTGALALVSAVQIGFLLRADATARISADAAKQSAEAAIVSAEAAKSTAAIVPAVERAFVHVIGISQNFALSDKKIGVHNVPVGAKVEIRFQNYGRTPANVEDLNIFTEFLDHLPTDTDTARHLRDIEEAPRWQIIAVLGTQGDDRIWSAPSVDAKASALKANPAAFFSGDLMLYCWGVLQYRDIFGGRNPTNFCRRYNWRAGQWEPVGGFERNEAK